MTADAMTGLATGKKQNRKQDILTPQVVVDFLHALWGPVIELDPCATHDPRDVVNARYRIHEPENGNGNGGLDVTWSDRTYVNPPYGELKLWLRKAVTEVKSVRLCSPRVVVLAPTRGHRDWWHEVRDTCDAAVELRPLNFIGYPGSFPAPLSLLCWNVGRGEVLGALQQSGLRYTKIALPGG